MKLYDIELGMDSQMLLAYFYDIEVSAANNDPLTENSFLSQALKKALNEIVTERLFSLRQALEAGASNNYIEEIRLREVLAYSLPSLSNENISLIVNSLKYSLLPSMENPFKRIYIPEFIGLLNNSDFELSLVKKEEVKQEIIEETKKPEIGEFIVKPKD